MLLCYRPGLNELPFLKLWKEVYPFLNLSFRKISSGLTLVNLLAHHWVALLPTPEKAIRAGLLKKKISWLRRAHWVGSIPWPLNYDLSAYDWSDLIGYASHWSWLFCLLPLVGTLVGPYPVWICPIWSSFFFYRWVSSIPCIFILICLVWLVCWSFLSDLILLAPLPGLDWYPLAPLDCSIGSFYSGFEVCIHWVVPATFFVWGMDGQGYTWIYLFLLGKVNGRTGRWHGTAWRHGMGWTDGWAPGNSNCTWIYG